MLSYRAARAGFDISPVRSSLHFLHAIHMQEAAMPYLVAWFLSVPTFVLLLIWLFVH